MKFENVNVEFFDLTYLKNNIKHHSLHNIKLIIFVYEIKS